MKLALLGAALSALLTSEASAVVTIFSAQDDGALIGDTYTNSAAAESAFLLAHDGAAGARYPFTEDFEGMAVGLGPNFSASFFTISLGGIGGGNGSYGVSDRTLGSVDDSIFSAPDNTYGFDIGTGTGKWFGFAASNALFGFTDEVYSFGFYATGLQQSLGSIYRIHYANDVLGTSHTLQLPINHDGGVSYFGFLDSEGFTRVLIERAGGELWGVDNVTVGFSNLGVEPGAVPEPATWAMMIIGFGFVGAAMRTARSSKSATA